MGIFIKSNMLLKHFDFDKTEFFSGIFFKNVFQIVLFQTVPKQMLAKGHISKEVVPEVNEQSLPSVFCIVRFSFQGPV